MSHVVVPNFVPFATTEPFSVMWKLTRVLLAAGWKYKASGDATGAAKETTGDASKDRWGVGGGINLVQVGAQTGTSPSIAAASSGNSIISSVSGFVANSVGRMLTIAGAVNANNNGTFRIVSQTGTTVTIFNPGAVVEVGTATVSWTEKQGGAAATIATAGTGGAIPGRAILTGLTGMVTPTTVPLVRGSVGDRITIINGAVGANNGTFMITRVISATSVEIDNSAALATGETNNGALIWVEVSPLSQTYALHLQGATGLGAWINLQGPSTMKIPVGTNVPTGTFLKGEVINQTTTGAQGVIIGFCPDTSGGLGYIVVEPRLNGTGGGVRGWSIAGDTITGVTSLATILTPASPVPIEYVRELVLWKNIPTNGHTYHQTVDQAAESASRFSVLAGTGGTTATICPGGATATFPGPGSWVSLGTGGSNAAGTGSATWFLNSSAGAIGNAHIMCATNIEGSGQSMDGSYVVAVGGPVTSPAAYMGTLFMRTDDGEEGDVDPYVTFIPSSGGQYPMTGSTRTSNVTNCPSADVFRVDTFFVATSFTPYKGWRRRGFPTGDAYQEFQAFVTGGGSNSGTVLVGTNPVSPGRVQTQATTNLAVRESIWIISTQVSTAAPVGIATKMRKGSLRWAFTTEGGVANTTYNNATSIQLGTSTIGPIVIGLWDSTTVPTNA